MFYKGDFVFNPARMELNSIVYNDIHDKAICSSLYEMFYVSREDIVLPEYLALIVKRPAFARYCDFLGSGSAREYCRVANISEMTIQVPSLSEQKTIVEIKRTIDLRQNVLTAINGYLAELCETIVSKYCADGDCQLADICHHVTERADNTEAELSTYVSTESLLQNKQGRQQASSLPSSGKVTCYQKGDTLVSNIRPYFKKVWYAPHEGTCSGDVLVFRANDPSRASYLHACLRQDSFFDHVMRGAKGTKMPRGDKKQMMEFPVAAECSEEDLKLLDASLQLIASNCSESEKLAELRDALLPKLMSCEIDVSRIRI